MKKISSFIFASALLLSCESSKNKEQVLSSEIDSVSYSLGMSLAETFQSRDYRDRFIEVNEEALMHGIKDVLDSNSTLIKNSEIEGILKGYNEKKKENYQLENESFYNSFLKDSSSIETITGLVYRVEKQGFGDIASEEDWILADFKGSFIDGEVFESTYLRGEPAVIVPGYVSPEAISEISTMVPIGSVVKIVVPHYLAFGARGDGPIPGYTTLIYEIELKKILTQEEIEERINRK